MQHPHSSLRQWAVSALLFIFILGYIWLSPVFPNAKTSGSFSPATGESTQMVR